MFDMVLNTLKHGHNVLGGEFLFSIRRPKQAKMNKENDSQKFCKQNGASFFKGTINSLTQQLKTHLRNLGF